MTYDLRTFETLPFDSIKDSHTVKHSINATGKRSESWHFTVQIWYKIFYNEFSRLIKSNPNTTRNLGDILMRALLMANETVTEIQQLRYYPPEEMFVDATIKNLDKNTITRKATIEIEFILQDRIERLAFEQ